MAKTTIKRIDSELIKALDEKGININDALSEYLGQPVQATETPHIDSGLTEKIQALEEWKSKHIESNKQLYTNQEATHNRTLVLDERIKTIGVPNQEDIKKSIQNTLSNLNLNDELLKPINEKIKEIKSALQTLNEDMKGTTPITQHNQLKAQVENLLPQIDNSIQAKLERHMEWIADNNSKA